MRVKRYMDPLSLVLKKLKLKGQGGEAVVNAHGKLTLNGNIYQQDEVIILRTYRFEGESDPGDAAIIYVVKANDGSTGYCMDGYGIYSSHTNDLQSEFIHNAIIATCHRT
jgi:hypothetical protein